MRFGSVCSGIEAASLAFGPLGWSAAWFSEIEPFPCAVLAHHYPDVPNLGDMTALPERVRAGDVEAPDMLCGGTPCQAFSVAGNRESLADARGNLTLTFCELADAIDDVRSARRSDPCVVFWENVPGVLSTKDNAFGCFLGELVGAGAALVPGRDQRWTDAGVVAGPRRIAAWRVLDAQHFGLAQRRRRVFVVASAREGFDPAAVLLERQGVRRHPAARGDAGEDAAARTARSADGGCDVAHTLRGHGFDASEDGTGRGTPLVPVLAYGGNNTAGPIDVATACNAHGGTGRMDFESETFIACESAFANVGEFGSLREVSVSDPLRAKGGDTGNGGETLIAFDPTQITSAANRSNPQAAGVRRLTPRECERLQGFPDDYTLIPWRGKPAEECPDGPRYKAIGNSWAVDCVAWIAERLDAELKEAA